MEQLAHRVLDDDGDAATKSSTVEGAASRSRHCARSKGEQFLCLDGGHSAAREWSGSGCSWQWYEDAAELVASADNVDGVLLWWDGLPKPNIALVRLRAFTSDRAIPLVVAARPEQLPASGLIEDGTVDGIVDSAWPPSLVARCMRLSSRLVRDTAGVLDIQNRVLEAVRGEVNKLYDEASRDELTGLFNRRHLMRVLQREQENAERNDSTYSVVFVDMDDLKIVNSTHGHSAGSTMLRELAEIIRQTKRERDSAARYGGDEFVVVLAGAGRRDACVFGERLIDFTRRHRVSVNEVSLPLSLSLGVATYPEDGESPGAVLQKADEAMYEAKNSGKNRVACCSPGNCARLRGLSGSRHCRTM